MTLLAEPGPGRPGTEAVSLRRAAGDFVGHPGPRLLLPATGMALAARVALGKWTRRDLGIAGGILAAEPFTEWAIHVFVLHMKPRTVRGRKVDTLLARGHRWHHSDPRDPDLVFVPMPVLRRILPAAVAGWLLAERRLRPAVTGLTPAVTRSPCRLTAT